MKLSVSNNLLTVHYPIITINNVDAHCIYWVWAALDASLRCGHGPHQYKPWQVKTIIWNLSGGQFLISGLSSGGTMQSLPPSALIKALKKNLVPTELPFWVPQSLDNEQGRKNDCDYGKLWRRKHIKPHDWTTNRPVNLGSMIPNRSQVEATSPVFYWVTPTPIQMPKHPAHKSRHHHLGSVASLLHSWTHFAIIPLYPPIPPTAGPRSRLQLSNARTSGSAGHNSSSLSQ